MYSMESSTNKAPPSPGRPISLENSFQRSTTFGSLAISQSSIRALDSSVSPILSQVVMGESFLVP
jgi:hypothetical protein